MDQSGYQTGTLKMWMEDKAFGFIVPDGGGDDVMIHKNNVAPGAQLTTGMQVQFTAQWEPSKGKMKATSCTPMSWGPPAPQAYAAPPPMPAAPCYGYAAPPPQPQQGQPCDNLFISGLPLETTEDKIREVFTPYGAIASIKILPNNGTKPDTAALVQMVEVSMAQWMVENLDGNIPVGLPTPIGVKYSQRSAGKSSGKGGPSPYGGRAVDPSASPFAPACGGYGGGYDPSSSSAAWAGGAAQDGSGVRYTGIVKAWIEEKGMGFIANDAGGEDAFVHRSWLLDGQYLVKDSRVSYEDGWDPQKNKRIAKNVYGAVAAGGSPGTAPGFATPPPAGAPPPPAGACYVPSAPSMPAGGYSGNVDTTGMVPGTVKAWYEHKGMGFIAPEHGGEDVFVHRSALIECTSLSSNQMVLFEEGWDAVKGKRMASRCVLTGGYATPAAASQQPLRQGSIKMWMEDKAFGFIVPADGGDDVMIHKNEVTPGLQLQAGMQVQFAASWDAVKGKYKASLCTAAGENGASAQDWTGGQAEGPPQPHNNLFIAGLPPDITEEKVMEVFVPYGSIASCKLVGSDAHAGSNAALVDMVDINMAKWMVDNLDGNIPVGLTSPIQVRYANQKNG
eukprot:CAMPEP_0178428758 /NCGR_PEP_ID=MMETSP0689_2-20121128/30448_1 /TAXON_ID=160604 /ORGANISM="Amphidinium massartii, Strain CS-259" /LENGTH=615 /DNA_ID=CAMNT_0020050551 /DNA_START=38 /DNA_END=1881 /DNA_ORIENTATION=-